MFNNYLNIEKNLKMLKNKILFLSNMMPEKGYLQLFNGFKLLNKKFQK